MSYFTEHLETVSETYFQHLCHACRFSFTMAIGSVACLLHAIFPFLFVKTGSQVITKLHHDMVTHRDRLTPKPANHLEVEHNL